MITERELDILKKSILLINSFKDNVHNINSGKEFISIHNRNIETIENIASDRNSEYLVAKLAEYPSITISQIDEYIKMKKNEISLLHFLLVFLFGIVIGLYYFLFERFLKTGKVSGKQIKVRILKIIEINKYVLEVVENPYMENLRLK
ncbi:hypothetical protein BSF41_16910 [Flavobacterium sp. ACN2]|jgi:hypothetical protein|uniref:hypothetical protein n=1 Tax=Flavobacterium sp. ACN2 TaxID=1975676 RepID=UPI000BB3DB8D|nr:hypothetical protein [Flavobacterium sp. ACN2]PBI90985.1 hypothetical protein BSF41_16910 [Flavobacterium sp. ACN2]